MSKQVTINAPTKLGKKTGKIEITGKVALLYVGAYRYKFLLQDTITSEVFLTHYDSGQRLGSLTPIHIASHRSYNRMPEREAAKILIERLVRKHGAEAVQAKLNQAPVIN